MSDAALIWTPFGADIEIKNGDFTADSGLATAVLISLFTDQRAPDVSLLPDSEESLRGWWGDLEDFKTGSLLWLLQREKMVSETATRAREYCLEALAWIIDEGIAEKIEVEADLRPPSGMNIKIYIYRGAATRYSYLWRAIENYEAVTVENSGISIDFIE